MIPQSTSDPGAGDNTPRYPAFSGTGRTSLLRGCVALLLAPALAVFPLSLLFFAVDIGGSWEAGTLSDRNLSGVLPLVATVYAVAAGVTVVLGGPTWIVFRLLRRESARTYGLAGAVEGLLCAFHWGFSAGGALRLEQMLAFALCSVTGCVIAVGFWFIARDRRVTANASAAAPILVATGPATESLNLNSKTPSSGLGTTMAEAQASSFFSWFHLTAVDDVAPIDDPAQEIAGRTWHRFRPSGPSFQPLVELAVAVGGDERISAACLGIDRAFIANARIRPFARDIAKSFLNWILPEEACIALAADIDAISQFCDGESVVITRYRRLPAATLKDQARSASGDMADVFIGNSARAEQTIGSTRIAVRESDRAAPSRRVLERRRCTSRRARRGTGRMAPDRDRLGSDPAAAV